MTDEFLKQNGERAELRFEDHARRNATERAAESHLTAFEQRAAQRAAEAAETEAKEKAQHAEAFRRIGHGHADHCLKAIGNPKSPIVGSCEAWFGEQPRLIREALMHRAVEIAPGAVDLEQCLNRMAQLNHDADMVHGEDGPTPQQTAAANAAALTTEAIQRAPTVTRTVLAMEAGEKSKGKTGKDLRAAMRKDVLRTMKASSRFWRNNPGAAKQAAHKAVREATKR